MDRIYHGHLERDPQQYLAFWQRSVQIEPAVQHQARLEQHLSERKCQGPKGLAPAVRELHTNKHMHTDFE